MRLISFSLTTRQVRESTPENPLKDVTRRRGWGYLTVGERLMACEKVMGRRKGEPLVRLREIEVVNVRREQLKRMIKEYAYGKSECVREGFPEMTPISFVGFFCESHSSGKKKCTPEDVVTRIEFKYVGGLVG